MIADAIDARLSQCISVLSLFCQLCATFHLPPELFNGYINRWIEMSPIECIEETITFDFLNDVALEIGKTDEFFRGINSPASV